MKKRYQIAIVIVLLLLAVSMGTYGCQEKQNNGGEDDSYVIGVATKSSNSEFWMSVSSGMEKASIDFGVSVLIVSPDTETDDQVQKKMIDNLLKRDIDALAVSPIDSYNAQEYLERAREMGIPVFSYDTQIADETIPYIGIDNYKIGSELAAYMAKQLGNQGNVGIISGNLSQIAHKRRVEGFEDYIRQNTDINVVFVKSGYSNLRMSEREISALIEEHPNVSGILANSAVTALGIMEYLREKPVLIATVDAQEDAIAAVKSGKIAALATQSGYDIGYETIRYIVNQKNGVEQDMEKILDVDILTKDSQN